MYRKSVYQHNEGNALTRIIQNQGGKFVEGPSLALSCDI